MDACTTFQPLNVVGCHLVLVDISNLHLHSRGFQKKAPDVVYQDVLNKFDSTWGGVKGLIMTWSSIVVTWKVRPHMGIISSGYVGSPKVVMFRFLSYTLFFKFCQFFFKKKIFTWHDSMDKILMIASQQNFISK